MFHLRFGLSDHLKALLDFVFGSRRRVKKVRIFRAWFSHYEEGCYNGEDFEDVKRKWEAKKEYFLEYKKDGSHPPCIDLAMALHGFDIDNTAAYHAIEDSKALHARRWQTKEGIYRIKRQALPDVRDAPLNDDNAAASSTNVQPRWRNWDEDYAMGYQRHP